MAAAANGHTWKPPGLEPAGQQATPGTRHITPLTLVNSYVSGDKHLDDPDEPCGVLEQEVMAGIGIHKQPCTGHAAG